MECRISDDSPFGKALLGHKVGDIVEVEAPIGVLKYKICLLYTSVVRHMAGGLVAHQIDVHLLFVQIFQQIDDMAVVGDCARLAVFLVCPGDLHRLGQIRRSVADPAPVSYTHLFRVQRAWNVSCGPSFRPCERGFQPGTQDQVERAVVVYGNLSLLHVCGAQNAVPVSYTHLSTCRRCSAFPAG